MKEIENIIKREIETLFNERFEAFERKYNNEVLLTEDEASKELKICSKTLANMRRRGRLSKECYFKIGRSVRYKRNKLLNDFNNFI
tara:strand:+ start:242 stop:499 length:258 start_codon:yes stop_codon:yes gene_type:complete